MNQPQRKVGLTRRGFVTGVAALAGAVVITACTGGATGTSSASGPAAQSASAPAVSTGTVAVSSPVVGQKVDANTASVAELQRAFETASIPSAARWAREVEEYRPYPTDDPSFAKLRRELAKYNPGPGVVDQIVATLTL
jgi:hypothetical protein